jgi:Holliday junction resolvasome RuvABC endonuclease subunit
MTIRRGPIHDPRSGEISGVVWMGIDQSLTAFAVSVIDKNGIHDTRVLKSKLRGVSRLDEIDAWLAETLTYWKAGAGIADVAMEGTVVHSASASVLGELAGVVKLRLHHAGFRPLIVPPMSLKKFVIGNAKNAAKSQMLMATYKRYGVEFSDDNAADAYGLARISRGECLTQFEVDVVKKLSDPKFREQ